MITLIMLIGSLLLIETNHISALPVDTPVTKKVISYLVFNNYWKEPNPAESEVTVESSIQNSLKELQRFGRIPITGKVDAATEELINRPKCGLPDLRGSNSTRKRRYALHGKAWLKRSLTWKLINNNDDGLTRELVENTLTKAFGLWSAITNLKFRKIEMNDNDLVDIKVSFAYGYHFDNFPFDGEGGELAHSFFPGNSIPELSGDVHFDDAEIWSTAAGYYEKNLLWVATHEIGHSIGIEHSSIYEAVMYPYYHKYWYGGFELHFDDIRGAQALYGIKRSKPATTTTTSTATIDTTSMATTTTTKAPSKISLKSKSIKISSSYCLINFIELTLIFLFIK